MKPEHALRLIDETQSLTRHYASYQRQKGGLGYTLGGLVLLTASLLALFLKPGPISTLSMCGFTLLWLIGKAVLSNCLYTPLGRVKERWSPSRNRLHVLRTVVGMLLISGILLPTLLQHTPDLLQLTFLAFFLLIAACTIWFCLRRPGEWLSGLLLLSICVFTAIGNTNILQWLLLLSFIVALACIVLGVREHLQFRALIEQLQTGQQAALWQRYAASRSFTGQHSSSSPQQWPLFYVLTASIVSAFAMTHLPFAAPFCAGTILLLALQKRSALQACFAPVPIGHITRRLSCSTIASTNNQQR